MLHTQSEPQLTAEESFHRELGQLVNELTHKVLIHQPDDVNLFLADYLEDKIRRERRKGFTYYCPINVHVCELFLFA